MKCIACRGRGFTEREHGLIQINCEECDGTGEGEEVESLLDVVVEANAYANALMPHLEGEELNDSVSYVGMVYQLAGKQTDEFSIDELWMKVKEASLEKTQVSFPLIIDMPCGKSLWLSTPNSVRELPIEDIPCPCGNPNHYIVMFIDNREVANDSNSGIGSNNQLVGSPDTSQPKQPQKPKIKKKARARSS